jgi:hypothetical protein
LPTSEKTCAQIQAIGCQEQSYKQRGSEKMSNLGAETALRPSGFVFRDDAVQTAFRAKTRHRRFWSQGWYHTDDRMGVDRGD